MKTKSMFAIGALAAGAAAYYFLVYKKYHQNNALEGTTVEYDSNHTVTKAGWLVIEGNDGIQRIWFNVGDKIN